MLAERAPLGVLVPGAVSAPRIVPSAIERPEYMFHSGPEAVTASDVKDAETNEYALPAGLRQTPSTRRARRSRQG